MTRFAFETGVGLSLLGLLVLALLLPGCGSGDGKGPDSRDAERRHYQILVERLEAELADLRTRLAAATGKPARTVAEARERLAELRGETAGVEARMNEMLAQERKAVRQRWTLWLTVVSVLGAAGCFVAAWFLPVGRKTLVCAGMGLLVVVPFVVWFFNLIDSFGWLLPLLVIGAASLYLLPVLRTRLLNGQAKP